jgi:hypothetical protein
MFKNLLKKLYKNITEDNIHVSSEKRCSVMDHLFFYLRYLLHMSLERARNLVQSFNDGEYEDDIEPYFNNLMNFFRFINKYGLLDEIDVDNIPDSELDKDVFDFLMENNLISSLDYHNLPNEFKNYFLLHGLEHNYKSTVIFITDELLTDVEIRSDGFYLFLRDREELADFFCSNSRNTSVSDVAKYVFGEDSDEWFYNDYTKPSEVIDVLNESNITRLKDVIYKEIGDIELSLDDYDTDFFESLSEKQGTEGYFTIKPEDLNDLIKDDASINKLCNGDLSDLGSELSSLYRMSENTAYEDELYSLVYDGLSEYFDGKIIETPKEVTLRDGTKKTRYDQHIKIRDFVGNVESFLNEYAGSGYNDTLLEYYGHYTTLIKDTDSVFECIDFSIPDYPDYSKTVKNVNEYFTDYI